MRITMNAAALVAMVIVWSQATGEWKLWVIVSLLNSMNAFFCKLDPNTSAHNVATHAKNLNSTASATMITDPAAWMPAWAYPPAS